MKTHHAAIAWIPGAVYARCRCGWEGTRRPVPRGSCGDQETLRAADREATEHAEQATHNARAT